MLEFVSAYGYLKEAQLNAFWTDFKTQQPGVHLTAKELKILFHVKVLPFLQSYVELDDDDLDALKEQIPPDYDPVRMQAILESNEPEYGTDYRYVQDSIDSSGSNNETMEELMAKAKSRHNTKCFVDWDEIDSVDGDYEDEEEERQPTPKPVRIKKTEIEDKKPDFEFPEGFVEFNSCLMMTDDEIDAGMRVLPPDELLKRMKDPKKIKEALNKKRVPFFTLCVRNAHEFDRFMRDEPGSQSFDDSHQVPVYDPGAPQQTIEGSMRSTDSVFSGSGSNHSLRNPMARSTPNTRGRSRPSRVSMNAAQAGPSNSHHGRAVNSRMEAFVRHMRTDPSHRK
jgi:hypothetical protein